MPATLIVHPDGRHVARYWEPGTRPAYVWIKRAVAGPNQDHGWIELLAGHEEQGVEVYGNEEARLLDLSANVEAMRRLNWPEPQEGWSRYDGNMGNHPGTLIYTSREEYEADRGRYWSPVCGPVVFILGFAGLDDEGEYLDKQESTDDLGTDDASQIKAIMDRARDEAVARGRETVPA
jgi:hypothetical protein